ncbi:MAG: zinc ribbon domain-containing protein [Euryarchaeota archaeon]|nr:zinc ribbon domain-containing protein [Euryarchaeota archaeon]MDE1835903.1 zinc ribbon domain-containing protein [Euryarchaeota archaeon]MDE1880222.1 zinc ribbon domain-containing protein [Euryarchaeota archaeon]MDE2044419.1 zinc ribbon domain-containing protein [Thermoplasmata archaeon]
MRASQLIETKALRCSSCGAPLRDPTGDLVSCDHCGTVQKLVDARAFLDQIMLQVNAFVRQALPLGLDASSSTTIDPVARHNLWVSSVGPRLSTEYGEYRFRIYNLLSHTMTTLPFTLAMDLPPGGDPKEAFLFQAKVQSVASLAVDEASRATVAESAGLAVAYAYALNNAALLKGTKPERYHLMGQNFADAALALHGIPRFSSLEARFLGLSRLSDAIDQLSQADVPEARAALEEALPHLSRAKEGMTKDFDLAVMLQAVDEEISLTRAAGSMTEAVALDPRGLSAGSLGAFQGILQLLVQHRSQAPPLWQRTFRAGDRQEKVLAMTLDARRAQANSSTVKVAPLPGPMAVPFWVVEAPYSFQTGAAWRKHAVEVPERLLIAASFPLDAGAMSGQDVAAVLTDVFSARQRSGLMQRLGGKETSISEGGPVQGLLRASTPRPLAGMRVVPPLSTPEDALVLAQTYIDTSRRTDPTLEKQLKLSSPRIVDLVYVPVGPVPPGYPLIPPLGPLSPRSVGDPSALARVAL